MEKEILELLKQVNNKLDEHTVKLDEHTMKLNEHTEILRALEHLAQVNRAEHDKMFNEIAHIKGETESIRKDLAAVEIVTARNMESLAHLKLIK
ncbi:hypothetical protein KQI89_12245 [Clostridium sp. MSJ-4]|uniref:Uncharacterized protein n=1 Tax=Clostridium simiarum TaxID=2841506 RepID=A0ABS6F2K5_9CLOT|nr:hypothetical protein [Clostridium simiarum]MBU5592526.1 hypothetical protein [Clostridium simiarum]